MNGLDVSVLTVNYKTPDLVERCVASVLSQQGVTFDMWVVDNASGDDSVPRLKALEPQIHVMANADNKGFGAANNQAARESRGRYLFLLNPDAVCTSDQDLAALVAYMEAHPKVGLVGTRITNNQGECQVTAFDHYPREKQSQRDFSKLPGRVATVLGASMFIRREAFEKIGGFDEDYFLYAEETDLCLRLREAGYEIAYFEGVTVQHVGGGSEHANPRLAVIRMKKAGKYLFYQKHYPRAAVIAMAKKEKRQAGLRYTGLCLKQWLCRGLNERDAWNLARQKQVLTLVNDVLARLA